MMHMKPIFLLTFVCIVVGSMQKRSSVLTDESKRILDIFDFSNFDKQEALSYIDRQRFENLIRGKRSKWNLAQNLFSSNLSAGDYEDCNSQHKKIVSKSVEINKNAQGMKLTTDRNLELNSRNELDVDEGKNFESFQRSSIKPEVRRVRSTELMKNVNNLGYNISQLNKSDDDSVVEEFHSKIEDDEDEDDEDDKDDGWKKRRRKRRKKKKRHHWSKWTEWSPCSVTCGKGREIRSRKCIAQSCASGDIEMGEKTCQLPACSLFEKLFSFLM